MEGSIAILGDFSTRPCALQLDKFLLVRGDFHSSSHIILYCTTSMQILEIEVPCGRDWGIYCLTHSNKDKNSLKTEISSVLFSSGFS